MALVLTAAFTSDLFRNQHTVLESNADEYEDDDRENCHQDYGELRIDLDCVCPLYGGITLRGRYDCECVIIGILISLFFHRQSETPSVLLIDVEYIWVVAVLKLDHYHWTSRVRAGELSVEAQDSLDARFKLCQIQLRRGQDSGIFSALGRDGNVISRYGWSGPVLGAKIRNLYLENDRHFLVGLVEEWQCASVGVNREIIFVIGTFDIEAEWLRAAFEWIAHVFGRGRYNSCLDWHLLRNVEFESTGHCLIVNVGGANSHQFDAQSIDRLRVAKHTIIISVNLNAERDHLRSFH